MVRELTSIFEMCTGLSDKGAQAKIRVARVKKE
jgi:hypothetical protein